MKTIKILAAVLLLTCLAGCNGKEVPTNTPTAAPAPPVVTQTPETRIETEKINAVPAGWTVIGEMEYAITAEDAVDTITLSTSAIREEGELMLDDSQEWLLSVDTANGIYPLYRGHTHGTPYMEFSEFYVGDEAIPVITLYVFSSAGTQVQQYHWRDGAFYETTIYTSDDEADGGINRIYSTIPAYE